MAGSIQLIYLIIKKILNIINWLNLNFCNSYLLKFPLKKEENSMKETNIIYDSVSNTWSIIVKVVNKSLLQIEYPELTGYKTKEDAEIAYHKAMHQFAMDMETMQMMLYALLTVPRETLSRTAYSVLETYVERINPLVSTLIETETMSTYDNEDSCEKIDYFRHIRNAVAHSKCNYFSDRGKNFVIFSDSNNNGSKVCSIKMECYKVGIILMELQRLIMEYYNQNH